MATRIWRSPTTRRTALAVGGMGPPSFMSLAGHLRLASASSTLETNRALMQRLFRDGFNAGDPALVAALCAPLIARAHVKATAQYDFASMAIRIHLRIPGVEAAMETLVAEGDLVDTRVRWFAPGPPNGIHFLGQTLHMVHVVDGQVIQLWRAGWENLQLITA